MRWLSRAALCLLLPCIAPTAGDSSEKRAEARLLLETDVSFATNLVHWVDNLSGTSAGKTMPVYQQYWRERFGPMDAADRAALETFARIRGLRIPPESRGAVTTSGCLPVQTETLNWRQIFLSSAMQADSIDELVNLVSRHLGDGDRSALARSLERFRPRLTKVWRDLGYVRRFQRRFHRFLKEGRLLDYLGTVAGFMEVDPAAAPSMKISFIGLPSNGSTHAEADGEHLLVEIRPLDSPEDQIQVLAHEASHFLMRLMTAKQIDVLASQAYGEGDAGALLWKHIWEGLPTALGQGLAEARLGRGSFTLKRPWYHTASIDQFAKLIYPFVDKAVDGSRSIAGGLITEAARALREAPLYREAWPGEFLMTAFFASGEGLSQPARQLRLRMGLGRDAATSGSFDLDDPAVKELLSRYTCMGGVVLIRPHELERAARLDGTDLLSLETIQKAKERAREGMSVILTGRRAGGGAVYYLVAPGLQAVPRLVEAFAGLKGGAPTEPLIITDGNIGSP